MANDLGACSTRHCLQSFHGLSAECLDPQMCRVGQKGIFTKGRPLVEADELLTGLSENFLRSRFQNLMRSCSIGLGTLKKQIDRNTLQFAAQLRKLFAIHSNQQGMQKNQPSLRTLSRLFCKFPLISLNTLKFQQSVRTTEIFSFEAKPPAIYLRLLVLFASTYCCEPTKLFSLAVPNLKSHTKMEKSGLCF